MRLAATLRRHPLVSYFVLAFAISWTAVLAVILPTTGIRLSADTEVVGGGVFVAGTLGMLLGPSVAGLTLTAVTGGRAALRELRGRMTLGRVSLRDYALLALAPALYLGVVAILSIFDPAYLPRVFTDAEARSMLLFGLVYSLVVGFFEELGWTGFATPRLIERHGTVRGALVLGVLWSAWHWLVTYWGASERYGTLFVATQASAMVQLAAFRVVMTVVYERTGSVLMAQLLHATLTAMAVIPAAPTTKEQDLLSGGLFSLSMLVAAIVVAGGRARRAQRPRPA